MEGFVPIGKLFNLEKGELQSTKCTPGEFDFITAAENWKTHNEYTHECEALIIAVAASGSLGRTHYVDGKFISSDLCFILTPKDEEKYPLNLAFYHFVFNSLRPVLVAATKSGTSKESINQTNLKKYEMPYFDIEQQDLWIQKLKNTLVRKELLCTELTHQQTLLKKLRQQILQEAIEGKLTEAWRANNPDVEPASELLGRIQAEKAQLIKDKKIKKQKPLPPISEDEKPFDLPDGWVWCRTGVLLNKFSTGPFGSMLHKSDYVKNGIPLVNPANIIGDNIFFSHKMMIDEETRKRLSKYVLREGEFVIARRGDLSKCAIVGKKESGWLCGTGSFFIRPTENIYKVFFVKVYKSFFFQKQLSDTSIGQTMANLNQKILNAAIFPLPPLPEQKVIVTKVEKLLALCDQLESQITRNQTHANALMQAVLKEAFSQQDDIQDRTSV